MIDEPADNKDEDETDYEVGYKRPPAETRFRPGRSGNPKGRPKGRRNLKTDLEEELSEHIAIHEGDKRLLITKQRALVKSTIARAIKGDTRAQAKAYELLMKAFGIDDEVIAETNLSEGDKAILDRFFNRNKDDE